jgi:hypothetical protein
MFSEIDDPTTTADVSCARVLTFLAPCMLFVIVIARSLDIGTTDSLPSMCFPQIGSNMQPTGALCFCFLFCFLHSSLRHLFCSCFVSVCEGGREGGREGGSFILHSVFTLRLCFVFSLCSITCAILFTLHTRARAHSPSFCTQAFISSLRVLLRTQCRPLWPNTKPLKIVPVLPRMCSRMVVVEMGGARGGMLTFWSAKSCVCVCVCVLCVLRA